LTPRDRDQEAAPVRLTGTGGTVVPFAGGTARDWSALAGLNSGSGSAPGLASGSEYVTPDRFDASGKRCEDGEYDSGGKRLPDKG
jgi:hypothetical protein